MNRKAIVIIGSIVLILVVAIAIMGALSDMKPQPKTALAVNKKAVVVAEKIKYSNITTEIEGTGRVTSQFDVALSAEVSGKILPGNISLKKGERFRKGDLIIRIFSDDYAYSLKARKSGFLTLIANLLPDIKIDYTDQYESWSSFFDAIEMDKDLPDLPAIASKQLKIFLSSRGIISEYYAIQSDELRLDKYTIYAPFDGAFTDVFSEVGSIANPGSRIATMIKTGKLEIEVPVELVTAQFLQVGNTATITSDVNKQNVWNGRVSRIADFVDPATQSINVYVTVPNNTDAPLFKGQYLKVMFAGKTLKGVMELPRTAVSNGNFVYTVEDDKLVHRTVKIEKVYDKTLLFSGIEEGTFIVSEALINPVEGTEVEIIN